MSFSSYVSNQSWFALWTSMVNNKRNLIIFLNLLVAILFGFLRFLLLILIGNINESIFNQVLKRIQPLVYQIVFNYAFFNGGLISNDLLYSASFLASRSIGYLLIERVLSLYVLPKRPDKRTHMTIIAAEVIMTLINSHMLGKFLSKALQPHQEAYFVYAFQYGCAIVENLYSFSLHYVYLLDKNSQSSKESFARKLNASLLFNMIMLLCAFIFLALSNDMKSSIYILLSALSSAYDLYKEFEDRNRWKKIVSILQEELPSPTEEELVSDPVCLICRDDMSVGDSKKLPCGHCYHLECLEEWVSNHHRCPMCKYDLKNLLQNRQNEMTNEEREIRRIELIREQLRLQGEERNQDDFFNRLDNQVRQMQNMVAGAVNENGQINWQILGRGQNQGQNLDNDQNLQNGLEMRVNDESDAETAEEVVEINWEELSDDPVSEPLSETPKPVEKISTRNDVKKDIPMAVQNENRNQYVIDEFNAIVIEFRQMREQFNILNERLERLGQVLNN